MIETRVLRLKFSDYINRDRSRIENWEQFEPESWRIVSDGAPRRGEYADTLLQQLWEAFQAGYAVDGGSEHG